MNLAVASIEHLPIADESIDLIFTDPPYNEGALHLYDWLAKEAARVLKPRGFCLVMCGGLYLDRINALFAGELDYHWTYHVILSRVSATIWSHGVIARDKPILAYSKGESQPSHHVLSSFIGGGNDKRYHHWGQDVESARYFIECHSHDNDLVLDPFVGGGTTAVASELIGRRWIGFDVDPIALDATRARLNGPLLHGRGISEWNFRYVFRETGVPQSNTFNSRYA